MAGHIASNKLLTPNAINHITRRCIGLRPTNACHVGRSFDTCWGQGSRLVERLQGLLQLFDPARVAVDSIVCVKKLGAALFELEVGLEIAHLELRGLARLISQLQLRPLPLQGFQRIMAELNNASLAMLKITGESSENHLGIPPDSQ
eukprot:SAG11_NODE_15132_length_588_cov_0.809816_1_plen_147_part_00